MVDFARIQNRIYYGYTKAAIRLGTNHDIYRSPDGLTPIQDANFIATTLVGIDQDYTYKKAKKYGDYTWQFLPQNGLTLMQNYDYLVGGQVTYFIVDIASDDRLSPPTCVECNAIINLVRPVSALTPGTNPIQQYNNNGLIILNAVPCCILERGRMDGTNYKLPTSVKLPYYELTIPEFDNVKINTGDVITDDLGRRMSVISAERTKKNLGFRLIAGLLGA